MIKIYFASLVKLLLASLLALSLVPAKAVMAHVAILHPGDEIAGMTLTNGSAEARSLWVFCSSEVTKNVTIANCRVPQTYRLAIGHAFLGTDEVFGKSGWSELKWELYLDNRPVKLNDFGAYNSVVPAMAPSLSLIHEVLVKFPAWDVVLTDLQPGAHTLDGRVSAGEEEYSWMVNLVIEDESLSH